MSKYEALLDRYVERYNARDLDGCMDLYAEDAVQLMPDGLFEGRDVIRERLVQELAAFPDIEWGLLSFVEQGDAFADEWTFAGKIVVDNLYYDNLSVAVQLGLVPQPVPSAAS